MELNVNEITQIVFGVCLRITMMGMMTICFYFCLLLESKLKCLVIICSTWMNDMMNLIRLGCTLNAHMSNVNSKQQQQKR